MTYLLWLYELIYISELEYDKHPRTFWFIDSVLYGMARNGMIQSIRKVAPFIPLGEYLELYPALALQLDWNCYKFDG